MSTLRRPAQPGPANRLANRGTLGGPRGAIAALVLLLALCLGFLAVPFASAGEGRSAVSTPGTLRLSPSSPTVEVGRAVSVELWLDNGSDYYGLDVRVSYDPEVLRIDSGKATPAWDLFHPTFHFLIKNEADNVGGTLWYAVTNTNPAAAFSGTGRVCVILLTGVTTGKTSLSFSYAKGSTRDGDAMWPATNSVELEVRPGSHYVAYLPLVK